MLQQKPNGALSDHSLRPPLYVYHDECVSLLVHPMVTSNSLQYCECVLVSKKSNQSITLPQLSDLVSKNVFETHRHFEYVEYRSFQIVKLTQFGKNFLSHSLHGANNQLDSFQSKNEAVDNLRRPFRKIFLAFGYWEQLTAATNSFLDLTALAAYGGRQIVVPSVKDSLFYGLQTEKSFETLELYYDVSALNRTLRSHVHGALISWN